MILEPGNIYSGSKKLAVFTNPTELARKKGNLRNSYPMMFVGIEYPDAEAAYQGMKKRSRRLSGEELEALMVDVIASKLVQYPQLLETLKENGGKSWILKCSHKVNGGLWEGDGDESWFIRCLAQAYEIVAKIAVD